jgi:Rod binding domain-containing protein
MSAPLSGLPSIPDAALPAAVRSGSAADQQSYRSALGFEQVMLGQLVEALVPEGSALADSAYAGAVKDAFAQGLVDSGGIGLAQQLFQTMQRTSA